MNWMTRFLCFLYCLKCLVIISWLSHSVYLMTFPRNLNVYWNLVSSIFLLLLDLLAHALFFLKNTVKTTLFNALLIVFLIGIGPVMIFLSLFGSFTDSINYDQEFCRRGCALSIFFRDFHSVVLYIFSIAGLASCILYVYYLCIKSAKNSWLLATLFSSKPAKIYPSPGLRKSMIERRSYSEHRKVLRTLSI